MLLRYKFEENYYYQLYVGQDKTSKRWGKLGTNHLRHMKLALNPNKQEFNIQAMEIALLYFGPENAIVFTIGDSKDEKSYSTEFPLPNGTHEYLPKSSLSLSPYKGAAK